MYVGSIVMCFFFSSRRRHTRFKCDWSSDVCSSDLSKSVVVRDPSEIVIARISVTALAIRKSVSDRVIVVSLNDRNSGFTQNLAHSIRQWAECAEISKTVQVLNLGRSGIFQ